jgi:hypothetical protein
VAVIPARRGPAAERAEALLLAHLSPAQRLEYRAHRTITVVKEGVLWRTVSWYAAAALAIVVLGLVGRIVPALGAATVVAAVGFVTALGTFLVWIPPLAIACTRRRVWTIGAGRRPTLELHGRRIPFCVFVKADLPEADRVLALKNVLEGDERYFLRRANALV